MADVPILVCDCGMRLKAVGAVPGRVGKCPACGGLLRVPDDDTAPHPSQANLLESGLRPSTFSTRPARETTKTKRENAPRRPWSVLAPPPSPESGVLQSLLYPLWADSSIALLVFLPPVFWFASIPLLTLIAAWAARGPVGGLVALLSLLPTGLILLSAGGYVLLYLGRVLIASAVGEIHPPRWPDWDISEMIRGLSRWVWAVLIGATLGGLPAVAYWMYCGDVDPLDAIILTELVAVGAVYAQVALLASILHDDPLGANPITVGLAIWRTGRGCLPPSLLIGTFVTLAAGGIAVLLEVENPPLAALGYWAYWVFLLYGAMVAMRVLGLYYHRHARLLGWFRERPRWGA